MTLKTCIHIFTCILSVECTHTCTHTALDSTNKNAHFLSTHKTFDKIIYTNTLALQHAFYTVLPRGRGSQTEVVLPPQSIIYQAMSGDICGCQTGGAGIKWVGPEMLLSSPRCPGWPPTETDLAPMSHAKGETFCMKKRSLSEI